MRYILITIAFVFAFSSLTYCQIESCNINGSDYCEELENLIERCKKGGVSESEVNALKNFMTFFEGNPKVSDYERMKDIGENLLYDSDLNRYGLDSTLKKSLKIINKTLKTSDIPQGTDRNKASFRGKSSIKKSDIILPGAILLILSLLLGYSRFQVYRLTNKNESLEDKIRTHEDNGKEIRRKIEGLERDSMSWAREKRGLNQKIESLESRVEELKNKSYKDQITVSERKPPFSSSQQTPSFTNNLPRHETYYLSAPNEDGSFKVKSITKAKEYHSYYKLIKLSEYKAEFEIINDKDLQLKAIDSYDRLIAPVCENTNNFDSNKTEIQQVERGELVLQGDIWKVTKKCKVRYI